MTVVRVEITPEVERLARRPYRVEITHEDGDYVGRIPELPGLVTGGATLEEMYAMVEDAKRMWIASALHHGDPVPEPQGILTT
jgi:antitoxin HicB